MAQVEACGKLGNSELRCRSETSAAILLPYFQNCIARFFRYFTDHQEPHEDHKDCGHLSKLEHLSEQERFKSQTGMH